MRASRLLSIQMLLETRGLMSAQALAAALDISVRTLHRDMDQLAAAGVPIYAERGRSGGFRLLDGWKTTLTGLTPAEAPAGFMTGLAGPATELGLGSQIEGARLKLLSSLPASWRDDAQRVSSRFHLDPVDWYRETDPVPHLSTVAAAVWEARELSMRYVSWTDTVERVVSPLGLVLKAGTWYLVAAMNGQPRTYRISNIVTAVYQEGRIKRPKDFELSAYWANSVRSFESHLYAGRAKVRATRAELKRLGNLSGPIARAIRNVAGSRRGSGRVEVTIPIESIAHALGQLLSPEIEVLEPLVLRRAMIERWKQIGHLYQQRVVHDSR
jgi:predicted DNA-binding transcriptional regulator YafY